MRREYDLSDNGLVIYLFHGVCRSLPGGVRNYIRKHIEADYFRDFLKWAKDRGVPLSLEEVLEHKKGGIPFPARSFAVTFDDGFENNFSVAAPILKELAVPATFYVTSKFIDQNEMAWIDRIEYAVDRAGSGQLLLPWEGSPRTFRSVEEAISILTEVRRFVKSTPGIDEHALADSIFEQLNLSPVRSFDDELNLKMSWSQVKALHEDPLFIIGGHTHTHRMLGFLARTEAEYEINTSLAMLREHAGISTRHYAYPEGLSHHYNQETIDILVAAGIECSPANIPGINTLADNLFHLKRVMVV